MHFSTYLQGLIAGYVRGTDFPTAPVSLEIALSSADPLADGSGLSEPPGADGYARQTLTLDASVATIGSGVSAFNNTPIVFGPVANNDWPTVTHVAVFDDSGNMLMHGPLNAQRTSPVGDELPFAVNALQLQTASYFGHFFGQMILEWMRGTAASTAPVSTELALSLADPLEDASALDEPILGYTRQTITFAAPGSTPSGTPIVSEGPYIFGPAVTNGWGLITYGAIMTPTNDLLLKGPVAIQRNVVEDDSFAVPFGALTILFT